MDNWDLTRLDAIVRSDGGQYWLSTAEDLKTVAKGDEMVKLRMVPAIRLEVLDLTEPGQPGIAATVDIFHQTVPEEVTPVLVSIQPLKSGADGALLALPGRWSHFRQIVRHKWRCRYGETYDAGGDCPLHGQPLKQV